LDEILQTDQLAEEGIEIDQFTSMLNAMQILQLLPIGTQVRVTFTRDNYVEQTLLTLTEDPARSWIDRGLILQPYARTHTADSLGGAIRLGLRETWRRVTQVVDFLKMLVTGRVGLGGLGGPGSIVYLASGEADAGITRLLLFLTLLSANLAILNFVPIPALDGGHMMFLTAELITGRPVSERLQATLTMCGVVALLALMAVAIFNDVNVLSRL
jgi:regulator of sigma E protease